MRKDSTVRMLTVHKSAGSVPELPDRFLQAIRTGDMTGSMAAVEWLEDRDADPHAVYCLHILISEIVPQVTLGHHILKLNAVTGIAREPSRYGVYGKAASVRTACERLKSLGLPMGLINRYAIIETRDMWAVERDPTRPQSLHVVLPPSGPSANGEGVKPVISFLAASFPGVMFTGQESFTAMSMHAITANEQFGLELFVDTACRKWQGLVIEFEAMIELSGAPESEPDDDAS